MIGTAVSASLVSLLGVVGATLVILVLILWMSVIILKVSIVDMLSKLINDYKLEKEKHQTEMRLLREQREKEVEKIVYRGSWKDFHYYQDIYNVAKEKGLLEKYGIEWGGNCWKSFKDAPHWQIKGADKVAFK